jgi:opacity protein-like surface antigen
MGSLRHLVWAGLVAASSTAASAADLLPPPPPVYEPKPAVEIGGGWYLRGDIGVSSQSVRKFSNPALDAAFQDTVEVVSKEFDSAPTIGVGVGYQVNSFLRFDGTLEYRSRASFDAMDRYQMAGSTQWDGANKFTATKSEVVGLVNGYLDLGTWYGITPFVGAGIGVAHVTIDNFTDQGISQPNAALGTFAGASLAHASAGTKTNLAWALYAGLGYQVSPTLALELAYRYIHLGDGRTGDTINYTGTNNVVDSWKFKGIVSHDFKVGMRWLLAAPLVQPVAFDQPIMRKY